MKLLQTTLIIFLSFTAVFAQQPLASKDRADILSVMDLQENAWNQGDLVAFMEGYWESDSLKFIGSRGISYGWQTTLDNYRKGYPDLEAMGKLTFTILTMEKLGGKSALVIGKWHLARTSDELGGHFSLIWKKIRGKWVIVADHSS
jgi:ketosteroid isomerase-like protein